MFCLVGGVNWALWCTGRQHRSNPYNISRHGGSDRIQHGADVDNIRLDWIRNAGRSTDNRSVVRQSQRSATADRLSADDYDLRSVIPNMAEPLRFPVSDSRRWRLHHGHRVR